MAGGDPPMSLEALVPDFGGRTTRLWRSRAVSSDFIQAPNGEPPFKRRGLPGAVTGLAVSSFGIR
jgi:hypothetical protein